MMPLAESLSRTPNNPEPAAIYLWGMILQCKSPAGQGLNRLRQNKMVISLSTILRMINTNQFYKIDCKITVEFCYHYEMNLY